MTPRAGSNKITGAGMPQKPGEVHPEAGAAIKGVKALAAGMTQKPGWNDPTKNAAVGNLAPKPVTPMKSMDAKLPGLATEAGTLAADKKAAGVGFLSNLIAKYKGVGNKTWSDLAGAGPATADRLNRTTGTRMALSEVPMEKATAKEADKEIQGFTSLASNPTRLPGMHGPKLPRKPRKNKE
jgi:hypothetical protein